MAPLPSRTSGQSDALSAKPSSLGPHSEAHVIRQPLFLLLSKLNTGCRRWQPLLSLAEIIVAVAAVFITRQITYAIVETQFQHEAEMRQNQKESAFQSNLYMMRLEAEYNLQFLNIMWEQYDNIEDTRISTLRLGDTSARKVLADDSLNDQLAPVTITMIQNYVHTIALVNSHTESYNRLGDATNTINALVNRTRRQQIKENLAQFYAWCSFIRWTFQAEWVDPAGLEQMLLRANEESDGVMDGSIQLGKPVLAAPTALPPTTPSATSTPDQVRALPFGPRRPTVTAIPTFSVRD